MSGCRNAWRWSALAVLALACAGCADRERITGPDTANPLDTETIGVSGGALEADGFRLIVPPGAFAQPATLILRDATATAPDDEDRLTRVFEVSGIPETIALPCSLQFEVAPAGVDEGSRWVRVEELDTFISSANRFGRCPITLETVETNGQARALLPATPAEEGKAGASLSALQPATGTMQISVVGNKWSHITPEGHFQILCGLSILTPTVQQIGTELERAYAMLRDDLGLSWANRTRRITVTIQVFEQANAEAWGLHVTSKWYGADYDELLLNRQKILLNPASDDIKSTVGHELFHLMQHLYDPRARILQGQPNEWFWVNEAMSTWFERKMLTRAHVPEHVRQNDYRFFLSHALQYTPDYTAGVVCNDCWLVQNHGYGASLFLGGTFERLTEGEKKIGDVLKCRLEGEYGPLGCIGQVLTRAGSGLDAAWRSFCGLWLDGTIYPQVPAFPGPSQVVDGRNDAFTFSSADQFRHTFQWQAANYAGRLYMFYFNPEAAIPLGAKATITYVDEEGGSELTVYSYKRDAIWQRLGVITQPGTPFEIANIGEWPRDGKGIAILVARAYATTSGYVPVAVQFTIDRCEPNTPVVLNGVTIPEDKITRTSGGCVTKIDLQYMSLANPNCLDGIDAHASSLQELSLYHNNLASVDLTDLERCKALKKLDLRYNGMQSVDLTPLGGCTSLELLTVVGNQLTSLDLLPLATCLKFRQLWIGDNQIQGLDLTPLAVGDSLRMLVLSNNKLSTMDLAPLASTPHLETLELNGCDLDAVNLAPLAHCPDLFFLAMGTNRITTIDLAPLANHTKLETVSFPFNSIGAVNLAPLATCPAMRTVNFRDNHLVSLDLAPLEGLAELRWLTLENNYLDGTTCSQVCAFQGDHPSCDVTSDCGCLK